MPWPELARSEHHREALVTDLYVYERREAMSDLEVSEPTRDEMLAELQELRAERVVGAQLLDAARARADQDGAEMREITADRDRWQASAEAIRSELWRQVDELRAESAQQHEQITQLSVSLAALLEAIVGTTPSAEAVETATGLTEDKAVAAAATVADGPAVVRDEPGAVVEEPAAVAAPPPPMLAPYVPANEPLHPHLQPKPEPEVHELVARHDHDRVGLLSELMAVADHSGQRPAAEAAGDGSGSEAPSHMNVLPTPAPVPSKRRRLGRSS